jgi:hypothetical protein
MPAIPHIYEIAEKRPIVYAEYTHTNPPQITLSSFLWHVL